LERCVSCARVTENQSPLTPNSPTKKKRVVSRRQSPSTSCRMRPLHRFSATLVWPLRMFPLIPSESLSSLSALLLMSSAPGYFALPLGLIRFPTLLCYLPFRMSHPPLGILLCVCPDSFHLCNNTTVAVGLLRFKT